MHNPEHQNRSTRQNRVEEEEEEKEARGEQKTRARAGGQREPTCAGEEAVDLGGDERVPPAGAARHGRALVAASTHSPSARCVSRSHRGGAE